MNSYTPRPCYTLEQLSRLIGIKTRAIYNLCERVDQLEAQAASPGLAESLATGVKHDAELIRKAVRAARLDECYRTLRAMDRQGSPTAGLSPLYDGMYERIRELEQVGWGTDDEQ